MAVSLRIFVSVHSAGAVKFVAWLNHMGHYATIDLNGAKPPKGTVMCMTVAGSHGACSATEMAKNLYRTFMRETVETR